MKWLLDLHLGDAIDGEPSDARVEGLAYEARGHGGDPGVLEVAVRVEQPHRPCLADAAHRRPFQVPTPTGRCQHQLPTQNYAFGSTKMNPIIKLVGSAF